MGTVGLTPSGSLFRLPCLFISSWVALSSLSCRSIFCLLASSLSSFILSSSSVSAFFFALGASLSLPSDRFLQSFSDLDLSGLGDREDLSDLGVSFSSVFRLLDELLSSLEEDLLLFWVGVSRIMSLRKTEWFFAPHRFASSAALRISPLVSLESTHPVRK